MEKLFNQKEVAGLLGVSTRTLERHRVAGTGPRYTVLGKLVRYRQCDLADYIDRNLHSSPSDKSLADDRKSS